MKERTQDNLKNFKLKNVEPATAIYTEGSVIKIMELMAAGWDVIPTAHGYHILKKKKNNSYKVVNKTT